MDALRFTSIRAPELIAEARQRSVEGSPPDDFKGLLREGIERLGALESEAAEQARALMAGEPVELHRVILAGEEAGLAFELMLSVRNKVVEAYQEVMRMQV